MKKKILELLTTKFEGVDNNILEGFAENLAKTINTEEEATTAVEGVTFQQLLKHWGDKRANAASVTAVSNYEKKYNLKDGKSATAEAEEAAKKKAEELAAQAAKEAKERAVKDNTPAPPAKEEPKPDNTIPAYIQKIIDQNEALIGQNKALSDRIGTLEGNINTLNKTRLTESRSAKLQKVISKLSSAQQSPYKRISLDGMSDEEFDSFLDETKGEVAEIEKEKAALSATGKPLMGNVVKNQKATDAEVDAVVGKINI